MDVQGDNRHRARGEWCLEDLAACQHGVVARAQLLSAGFGREAINGLLRRRHLRRLHRGIYLVGATPPPLAHEQAALLAAGPHAVLSHTTAAAFHQLLPYPAEGTPVEVTTTCGNPTKHEGITVHRSALSRPEWWTRSGLRVTTPLRTVMDLAASHPHALEPALREALAQRHFSVPMLREAVEARPGQRGTGRLHALLDADPRLRRSGAERQLLRLLRRARLPLPETNVRVGRWEVDMLWREQRLVVEVDAYATHSSPGSFEADHARDAELRGLGYVVLRFTVRQIAAEPEATIAAIARELASRAARRAR